MSAQLQYCHSGTQTLESPRTSEEFQLISSLLTPAPVVLQLTIHPSTHHIPVFHSLHSLLVSLHTHFNINPSDLHPSGPYPPPPPVVPSHTTTPPLHALLASHHGALTSLHQKLRRQVGGRVREVERRVEVVKERFGRAREEMRVQQEVIGAQMR